MKHGPIPRLAGAGGIRPQGWARLLAGLALAVIAAAATSRLFGLSHLAIWHDETMTLLRVFGHGGEVWPTIFGGTLLTPADILQFQQPDPSKGWGDTLVALAGNPEHPPLYYLLARAAVELPLDPVTAVRGVSAVFSLLLPAAVFWLMRELFGRGSAPWLAAVLVACSPLHLLYAQEARQYALWTLLAAASTAALVRALRRDRPGDWGLYAALVALGLYSHLLFVILLPVHGAYGWLVAARQGDGLLRPRNLLVRQWLVAVGVAAFLFLPWMVVVLIPGLGKVADHTRWMSLELGAVQNLHAWGAHFVRAFFNPSPAQMPSAGVMLLLIPLSLALVHFLRRAPRPQAWLLVGIVLAYAGTVLGPDLILGGGRSLHARYTLAAVLALQLMVAWSLAALLARPGVWRPAGVAVMAAVVGLGGASFWRIHTAETWWTKQFSAENARIARTLNALDRPLVVAGPGDVALGELISLAYHLDGDVRIYGHAGVPGPFILPAGFGTTVMLLPGAEIRDALGPAYVLEAVPGTWQWYLLRPAEVAAELDGGESPQVGEPEGEVPEAAEEEAPSAS